MNIPEWANWLARDEDGELWAYSGIPFKRIDMWDGDDYLDINREIEETDDTFSQIKWADEQPTSVKSLIKDFSDKAESLRELGEALTRYWEAEHGKPSVAEYNQWQITQAKAHGYDEVPEVADKTERVYTDKDGIEITVGETTSISFEEAMSLVENRMEIETDTNKDMVNQPSHYKGRHGLEAIEVVRNFGNDDMIAGFYWGNAIKYMTRYRNKNGLEDLKKARKNLDWLIEKMESQQKE